VPKSAPPLPVAGRKTGESCPRNAPPAGRKPRTGPDSAASAWGAHIAFVPIDAIRDTI